MALERCIRRTAQYGRLWEEGEVRMIDRFDEQGAPVVSAHFRLVEEGESVEDGKLGAHQLWDSDVIRRRPRHASTIEAEDLWYE